MFPNKEFNKEMDWLFASIPNMDRESLEMSISQAISYIRTQQVAPRGAGKMERIHTVTTALDRMWRAYNEG